MASTTQSNSQFSSWVSTQWNWIRELPKALAAHQMILVVVAIVAIVIDQATKWWVEANIVLHTRIIPFESIGHIFDFLHVKNPGAAFGMGQESGWLFTTIAFGVCGFILFYNSVILGKHPQFRVALGLIMGGALGNVIDRFRIGEVTDFIHFDFRPLASDWLVERVALLNFAIFNLADTFIFTAVIIMFVLILRDNLPDDPWTEEAEKTLVSQEQTEPITSKLVPAASAPSNFIKDDFQPRSAPSSQQLNWRKESADVADPKKTGANGRLGLKIAVILGIIALIATIFAIRKRRNRQ